MQGTCPWRGRHPVFVLAGTSLALPTGVLMNIFGVFDMASIPQLDGSAGQYTGFEKQWIGGEWKVGGGKGRLTDRNPYNGDVLIEIPHADEGDLDRAHVVAAEAQKAWVASLPADRSAIMQKAARVMERRHDEIVAWLIAEAGSTRMKAELEW